MSGKKKELTEDHKDFIVTALNQITVQGNADEVRGFVKQVDEIVEILKPKKVAKKPKPKPTSKGKA